MASRREKWKPIGFDQAGEELAGPLPLLFAWVRACPEDLREETWILGHRGRILTIGVASEKAAEILCEELPRIQHKLVEILGESAVEQVEIRRVEARNRDIERPREGAVHSRPPLPEGASRILEDVADTDLREAFQRLMSRHRNRFGDEDG